MQRKGKKSQKSQEKFPIKLNRLYRNVAPKGFACKVYLSELYLKIHH